jgi:hypothetical protein
VAAARQILLKHDRVKRRAEFAIFQIARRRKFTFWANQKIIVIHHRLKGAAPSPGEIQ